MNINPSYESIGSIFEKNILLEVPKYQRYYAWDDEQVEDYIKDINTVYTHKRIANEIDHFFGGVVVVKKDVPGSNRQQRELIDGQQRITTTILLMISVIRKFSTLITVDNRENIESFIAQLKSKYLIYNDRINRVPQVVPKLVLSNADNQYFDDIVNNHHSEGTRDSHRKIKKAYDKISAFVDKTVDILDTIDDKIDALSDFDNIVSNNCTIIFIDADSRESAYKLFQVLNDRGAGLTEGDLLKSKTLEVLEKHFSIRQEALQSSWDDILSDEPKQVETFLRYYFASVCGYRMGRTTVYDEFLSKFFSDIVDKDEVSTEAEAISLCSTVDNLLMEMRTYRKIVGGEWPYPVAQPITEWDRRRLYILVNYLNFDIIYPLLMASAKLDQKKFFDIVYMLEKFMFRYKSVCNLGHQKMSEIFTKEAVLIRSNPTSYRTSSLRNQLKAIIDDECNDTVFKLNLSNIRYRPNSGNKQLKYLFSMLDNHLSWIKSGSIGKPIATKTNIPNFDNITIEHISSQSPACPSLFIGDELHKLRNLTMLTQSENDDVANKPYVNKKPTYITSEFEINRYFDSVDEWRVEDSNNWLEYVVNMACKIFVV